MPDALSIDLIPGIGSDAGEGCASPLFASATPIANPSANCHHGRAVEINRPPGLVSPPRLHLWEDPTGEAPLADDNKVNCCSTIWCSVV